MAYTDSQGRNGRDDELYPRQTGYRWFEYRDGCARSGRDLPVPPMDEAEARARILAAMAAHPRLNLMGLEYVDHRGRPTLDDPAWRSCLPSYVREFLLSRAWLAAQPRTAAPKRGSYGLKHLAEYVVGYVGNGPFIAAAFDLGFMLKSHPDSPNPLINLPKKLRAFRALDADMRTSGGIRRTPADDIAGLL